MSETNGSTPRKAKKAGRPRLLDRDQARALRTDVKSLITQYGVSFATLTSVFNGSGAYTNI